MAKVADVKLTWRKSPSSDITGIKVVVTNNGVETTTEGGPEVQELMVIVNASGSLSFKVVSLDSEGNEAVSETYTFSLGDLEAPLPATDLFHEIVAVRDV